MFLCDGVQYGRNVVGNGGVCRPSAVAVSTEGAEADVHGRFSSSPMNPLSPGCRLAARVAMLKLIDPEYVVAVVPPRSAWLCGKV